MSDDNAYLLLVLNLDEPVAAQMVDWWTRVGRVAHITATWLGRTNGAGLTRAQRATEMRLARKLLYGAVTELRLWGGEPLTYARRRVVQWADVVPSPVEQSTAAVMLWSEWVGDVLLWPWADWVSKTADIRTRTGLNRTRHELARLAGEAG